MNDSLNGLFDRFAQTKVLVIGDVMVDTYLWGKTERMSPEAPVPVVDVERVEHRLGGAANVALNLAALGASVTLYSIIGNDKEGELLEQLLKQNLSQHSPSPVGEGRDEVNHRGTFAHFFKSKDRHTTVKTRLMSGYQQVVRFDRETMDDLNPQEESALLAMVNDHVAKQKTDVVVFQDYNKGVLTQKVIQSIIGLCRKKNIPTAVDPKKKNFFAYKGIDLFKPNLKEVREALETEILKHDLHQLQLAADNLRKQLNNRLTLITLSEGGVFVSDENDSVIYPAIPRNITDVSGAGDTVISVAALALAQGLKKSLVAQLANIAGGLVCEQLGVVPVDKEHFMIECDRLLQPQKIEDQKI